MGGGQLLGLQMKNLSFNSAHCTIFVFGRKRQISNMFDLKDNRGRQKYLLFWPRTLQVFVVNDKKSSSFGTEICCVRQAQGKRLLWEENALAIAKQESLFPHNHLKQAIRQGLSHTKNTVLWKLLPICGQRSWDGRCSPVASCNRINIEMILRKQQNQRSKFINFWLMA